MYKLVMFFVILILSITACSGSSDPTAAPQPTAAPTTPPVALSQQVGTEDGLVQLSLPESWVGMDFFGQLYVSDSQENLDQALEALGTETAFTGITGALTVGAGADLGLDTETPTLADVAAVAQASLSDGTTGPVEITIDGKAALEFSGAGDNGFTYLYVVDLGESTFVLAQFTGPEGDIQAQTATLQAIAASVRYTP